MRKKFKEETRKKDRELFNSVGKYSSDIYYVNEDKKVAAKKALLGGSRAVAEDLR